MLNYKKILLAVDLVPKDDEPVSEKAAAIAQSCGAELHLIHVVPYIYTYGIPGDVEETHSWQEEMETKAKDKMKQIGEKLSIPEDRRIITSGQAKSAIMAVLANVKADLIVLGSHGQHGLGLFIYGSTSQSILQQNKCDVLAVHVDPKNLTEQRDLLDEE